MWTEAEVWEWSVKQVLHRGAAERSQRQKPNSSALQFEHCLGIKIIEMANHCLCFKDA